MIGRYSSRLSREEMGRVLTSALCGATQYDRIAGYFRSSILEVAGEALDQIAPATVARVICNSQLDPLDVKTARAAKEAMRREWCESLPQDISPPFRLRLERLYGLLASGRLQVRVLPDERFGLVHGKAGVITRADGSRFCFMGSTNESKSAWALNYELVWTDDSPEGIAWVQDEFEALWHAPEAFELAEAVRDDIERLTRRSVISSVDSWRREDGDPNPAAPVVELPVYRRENGLWAHQKYFIKRAFEAHLNAGGARFLLADQVGLGKTVQLALAAKLMALVGSKPVLILVPRPLIEQWQAEMWDLLSLPSARWNGWQWVDEQSVVYPNKGIDELRHCPRRVGIVSTGLLTRGSKAADVLRSMDYECVILDEAHRARRRNIGITKRDQRADPNNLLRFMREIAAQTKSLLLATATPVQLDPIEAYDLLDVLNRGNERVLGDQYSLWATHPREGLNLVLGQTPPPTDVGEAWEWMRNPLPAATEDREFKFIRDELGLADDVTWVSSEALNQLGPSGPERVRQLSGRFFGEFNPYIRHIVRRTREYLEETTDPETNEPYLKPVRVRLFGEREDEAVRLLPALEDAYGAAEHFCQVLGKRTNMNAAFLRTILLRRVGSTIHAGQMTARKILGDNIEEEIHTDEDDEPTTSAERNTPSSLAPLSDEERADLQRFLALLDPLVEDDPKLREVERILLEGSEGTHPWLREGCIIFSQYYDSVYWLAERLSRRLPDDLIGVYAGASKSGLFRAGHFTGHDREVIKGLVRTDELRLVCGTDAASEGLNLQRLGTLVNLDLPWNPTRLEQRKGRIQRIGQPRDEVLVYNLRYRGSVEDRVHQLLSSRLEAIRNMFGQLPDTLEDAWVALAEHDEERARQIIGEVPEANPFEVKYDRIEPVNWESCARVLDSNAQIDLLSRGW